MNDEVPNNNATTPTDNNTTTENKVIVEHTAPTGDNMSSILKLLHCLYLDLALYCCIERK